MVFRLFGVSTLVLVGACSLVFGTDEHQGGVVDGGEEGGVDAAAACALDPDGDDDTHEAIACGGDDCDDTDSEVYPGAPNICGNGKDEICGDAPLRTLFGLDSSVTAIAPRTLFTMDPPELEADAIFVAPLSLAATPSGTGWFALATLERNAADTLNVPTVLRASVDEPGTYTQISNYVAAPPTFASLVGVALARDGTGVGEPEMDIVLVHRAPDGSDVLGYFGEIETPGTDIAITSLGAMTTSENVVFRPGTFMTGGVQPPQWVVGEVGAAALADRLNSCRQGSPGSCAATASTLAAEPTTTPVAATGSPSGHVFMRAADGALVVWNPIGNVAVTEDVADIVTNGDILRGRPAVTQIDLAVGLPSQHRYLLALPYRDTTNAARLAIVAVSCARGQTLGACTFGAATPITLGTNETFAGPVAIVAFGGRGFAVLAGVRSPANDVLRVFLGTFALPSSAVTLLGAQDLDTFPSGSGALVDVAAAYLSRVTQPSAISVVWQSGIASRALRTAAFTFCNVP
jgi:hypothetical protein